MIRTTDLSALSSAYKQIQALEVGLESVTNHHSLLQMTSYLQNIESIVESRVATAEKLRSDLATSYESIKAIYDNLDSDWNTLVASKKSASVVTPAVPVETPTENVVDASVETPAS